MSKAPGPPAEAEAAASTMAAVATAAETAGMLSATPAASEAPTVGQQE